MLMFNSPSGSIGTAFSIEMMNLVATFNSLAANAAMAAGY
jgi:hypothetical protein